MQAPVASAGLSTPASPKMWLNGAAPSSTSSLAQPQQRAREKARARAQAGMRELGALRAAGRAGGVEQDRGLVGPALGDAPRGSRRPLRTGRRARPGGRRARSAGAGATRRLASESASRSSISARRSSG